MVRLIIRFLSSWPESPLSIPVPAVTINLYISRWARENSPYDDYGAFITVGSIGNGYVTNWAILQPAKGISFTSQLTLHRPHPPPTLPLLLYNRVSAI